MINIIGQIRIYSLADLILFAYAIGANKLEIIGIVLLHVSFLFYLEYTHKHTYRILIPKYIWMIAAIVGIILYFKWSVIGYIVASALYVNKNKAPFSYISPVIRGIQYYFLSAGILGFTNPISLLAFLLITTRNFAGDLRDTLKDKKESIQTLPMLFGFNKDYKNIHIYMLFLTSFAWWYLSGISVIWLLGVYLIQIYTYNITTR